MLNQYGISNVQSISEEVDSIEDSLLGQEEKKALREACENFWLYDIKKSMASIDDPYHHNSVEQMATIYVMQRRAEDAFRAQMTEAYIALMAISTLVPDATALLVRVNNAIGNIERERPVAASTRLTIIRKTLQEIPETLLSEEKLDYKNAVLMMIENAIGSLKPLLPQ